MIKILNPTKNGIWIWKGYRHYTPYFLKGFVPQINKFLVELHAIAYRLQTEPKWLTYNPFKGAFLGRWAQEKSKSFHEFKPSKDLMPV